jgi:hypothetical protein
MENKEKDYKEERFEFTLFVNDNIICKRNFRIFNFIEGSMNTLEFKEKVDEIVKIIDDDLKSKSRVFTWYYFNPNEPDEFEEYAGSPLAPWACTFKITISDNKRDVITRIWDGYAYPKPIREKVDLSNKNVKITNKDGQTFSYEKDAFFKANEGRLSFEHEVLKSMIGDRPDALLQITKKICEACSPTKEELKEVGRFNPRDSSKYLANYTTFEDYYPRSETFTKKDEEGNEIKVTKKIGKPRRYAYSLYLANKKVENAWGRAVAEKTKKYFKNLY